MRSKKYKILLYGFFYLACLTIILFLSFGLSEFNERMRPDSVEFRVNNPQFQSKITEKINSIVLSSKRENFSKSQMFYDISKFLDQFDIINTYSLRLGFDKKLIVYADIQKPVLAIHARTGDVFIVGSAMKIIGKNPPSSLAESIPNIFLPEIIIRNKKDTGLNFQWFLEQVNLINENFQWYNRKIEKISWTKTVGFVVKFEQDHDQISYPEKNQELMIYLGHDGLEKKSEKVKMLSTILKQKNINPSRIDLDLTDRVFIK